MARQGVVGRGRADRGGDGRGHDRARDGGVDGAAGRMEDGARPRRRVRREDAPSLVRLARLLPRLPGRARRPAPAALGPEPRPARAPRVHGLARLLRSRRDLPERPARLPRARRTCSRAGCGSGFGRRGEPLASVWPTWVLAAAAVFLLGFRVGLNLEAPRGVIDVGLAGVVGASRILDGEAPYGNMPQRGDLEPCGPKDAEGQVRERIQTNGRCEAGIERGDTYGPVSYLAYVPAVALFPWSGKWDSLPGGARDVDRVRPARGARARPHRAAVRRPPARRAARVRVGRVSVHGLHAEREHERRDHARVPARRVLARHVGLGARRVGRARGLDEVRRAARRAAVGDVPGLRATPRAPLRGGVRRRDGARVLDPAPRAVAVGGGAHVLGAHDRVPVRARLAVLDLGLGPVPRARDSRPRLPSARRRRPRGRARGARGGRPAAQEPAAAGRAHGCRARRLPAHADPLVLPLPPVGRARSSSCGCSFRSAAIRRRERGAPRSRTPCRSRRRTRRPRPRSARRPEPSRSAREGRCACGGSRARPPRR